ncbi:conserved hypothetical protein [Coccidioides posadasii str. Silveira]|uniref:Uncharacterized protein n=2 Tax=Coccidioides posadasii TaxID=199306 RepID=E9CZW4_COCPS|nr:conserved hypothetical protein [Coccidioides posadasii str. Silveira]KMM73217.1 hypothetical protein CPAG_09506 [Coccidioides posadasii RMSCC 3488]
MRAALTRERIARDSIRRVSGWHYMKGCLVAVYILGAEPLQLRKSPQTGAKLCCCSSSPRYSMPSDKMLHK